MSNPRPTLRQITLALLGGGLLAASVVPLLFLVLGTVAGGGVAMLFAFIAFVVGAPVALAHALVLGLPTYLILRHYSPLNRIGVAIAGFAIGAVPVGLGIYWLPVMADPSGTLDARMRAAFGFGLLGAIGGLAFRHILQKLSKDGTGENA